MEEGGRVEGILRSFFIPVTWSKASFSNLCKVQNRLNPWSWMPQRSEEARAGRIKQSSQEWVAVGLNL